MAVYRGNYRTGAEFKNALVDLVQQFVDQGYDEIELLMHMASLSAGHREHFLREAGYRRVLIKCDRKKV